MPPLDHSSMATYMYDPEQGIIMATPARLPHMQNKTRPLYQNYYSAKTNMVLDLMPEVGMLLAFVGTVVVALWLVITLASTHEFEERAWIDSVDMDMFKAVGAASVLMILSLQSVLIPPPKTTKQPRKTE